MPDYRHRWINAMKHLVITIAALCFCQSAIGQDGSDSEIEEIIVIGELSKSAVRAQIIRVEDDIYRFYNARNGADKLDIECRNVALTGTRITQRVCEPVFWTQARARETQNFIKEFTGVADLEDLRGQTGPEFEQMNAVYAELIQKYSSFAEALAILEDLKARLTEL